MKTSAVQAAAEAGLPPSARQILEQLDGTIAPVPVGLLYRAGLFLLAVAMVLLPLIYVGLIGLAGWAVVEHAVHNTDLLAMRGGVIAKAVAYFGPIVVGATGIFFLIKPIFAPPPKRPVALRLRREDEPLLFGYVERLCQRVGAPVPAEIKCDDQVNASAGLKGLFGIFTGELVLTIGAPLIGAMDLRGLTGVLAHELGHFAQGTAMRLQYLIRSVNFWFTRVVYQRDAWDEGLESAAKQGGHVAIIAVLSAARLFVWLSRKILWTLMWVGNAISCFVARQMEYDADRYEARIAGCEAFSRSMVELNLLMLARRQADGLLDLSWSEGRACEDFVGLQLALRERMQPELAGKLKQSLLEEHSGFFDTHPSASDRIASVQREGEAGILHTTESARALLPRFEKSCKKLTRAILGNNLGEATDQLHFVAAQQLIAEHDAMEEGSRSFSRMFQGAIPRGALLLPEGELVEGGSAQEAEALPALRSRMVELAAARREATRLGEKLDEQQVTAWRAEQLSRAVKLRPGEFGLPFQSPGEIAPFVEKVSGETQAMAVELEPVFALARERLGVALRLAAAAQPLPELCSVAGQGAEIRRLYLALCALRPAFARREELRGRLVGLDALLGALEGRENDQGFVQAVLAASDAVRECATGILEECRKVTYPFDHASGQVPVSTVLGEELPPRDYAGGVLGAGGGIYSGLGTLYARAMYRLVRIAERTEAALGMEPLPEPPAEEPLPPA